MLNIFLGLIVVVFTFAVVLGFSRPATFRVERSKFIKASPQELFELLTDFHRSESWSPWEKKDLKMKKTFGGPPTGKGATFEWEGDRNVGHGRQTIVDAIPFSRIITQLDFFRPFKGRNMAEFLFEPVDGGTQVRWVMYGPLNFIVRVLCFKMDKMIGPDFETGLENIKAVFERTRTQS